MNSFKKKVANLAMNCARKEVNSACMWVLYQRKIPRSAQKLKK